MATQIDTHPTALPQGVGRLTTGWKLAMGASFVLLVVGIVAFVRELSTGMIATGMRNVGTMGGASWGLYITMVVYFIGVSFAGITIAALVRIFNLRQLRPIARTAELLTVVSLCLAHWRSLWISVSHCGV